MGGFLLQIPLEFSPALEITRGIFLRPHHTSHRWPGTMGAWRNRKRCGEGGIFNTSSFCSGDYFSCLISVWSRKCEPVVICMIGLHQTVSFIYTSLGTTIQITFQISIVCHTFITATVWYIQSSKSGGHYESSSFINRVFERRMLLLCLLGYQSLRYFWVLPTQAVILNLFFGDAGENGSVALLGILCKLKCDNYY